MREKNHLSNFVTPKLSTPKHGNLSSLLDTPWLYFLFWIPFQTHHLMKKQSPSQADWNESSRKIKLQMFLGKPPVKSQWDIKWVSAKDRYSLFLLPKKLSSSQYDIPTITTVLFDKNAHAPVHTLKHTK